MNFSRFITLSLAAILLSACGTFGDDGMFRDRKNDYLESQEKPALKLPDGMAADGIQDYFFVPPIGKNSTTRPDYEVPRPMRLVAGDTDNMVKIQSLGSNKWILMRQPPGQVWPRVSDFLVGNRIGVALEDGQSGVMETGWLVDQKDTLVYERYQFRVRQGVQRNSSEIYVLSQSVPMPEGQTPAADLPWPTVSTSTEHEQVFIEALAQFLAEDVDVTGSVSLKAQDINTEGRMYSEALPTPHIKIQLERERAWASLSYALDKSGFIIDDMNNEQGVFYVTYVGRPDDEEVDLGFWANLWSSDPKEEISGSYRMVLTPDAKPGWMNITVEKDAGFEENEREIVLNEVKGYLT